MKKVISYSLFEHPNCVYNGPVPFYERILPATLRAAMVQFPGWTIRIHHDSSIYRNWYGDVLCALQEKGLIELVYCGDATNMAKASLWRLKPIWDAGVEYVISRDVDSIATPREAKAVKAFIESGLIVHTINDHPQHDCPMMCGMIGFNAPHFRNLLGLGAESWDVLIRMDKLGVHWDHKNADQQLLAYNIWPKCAHVTMNHNFSGYRHKIPVRMEVTEQIAPEAADLETGSRFIGDVVNETAALGFYEDLKYPQPAYYLWETEQALVVGPVHKSSITHERYAVIGCDQHPDYMFYLPIVSLLWKKVARYTPLVFLIGSVEDWLSTPRSSLVLSLTRQAGAIINFIPAIPGYRTSTLAKCVRLYASYLPKLHENDYLLTTDVDLLPLGKDFFWRGEYDKLAFWFSNAYDQTAQPDMYPMCHVGGRVGIWRDLMGCNPSGYPYVSMAMATDLDKQLGSWRDVGELYKYRNGAGLFDDEMYLAEFLRRWTGYKSLCQFIPRTRKASGCPAGRLDKADWDTGGNVTTDAHGPRPVYGTPPMACLLDCIDKKTVQLDDYIGRYWSL